MTEETKPPFFINTRRLQSAESYFDIGRTQERLQRFLEQRRKPIVLPQDDPEFEEYGLVGYYGVDRYIKLDERAGDWGDNNLGGIDEDVQYQNTSMFSLFWMTFKSVAASIGSHFSKPKTPFLDEPSRKYSDPESNSGEVNDSTSDLFKILVHPTTNDPRVKEDMVVYGDMQYLVQKFRLSLKRGSVDVALFSVELPESTAIKTTAQTDLQTFVVSPECGSLVWIENGRASAIFMTKSTDDFFESVMEWFRKLLSDMTLADSVMIGHPYYWHPAVRRRLSRVMRQLKGLYQKLALKETCRQRLLQLSGSGNQIEVIRPQEISKIVINEHPSKHLMRSATTHGTLNVMLEHLITKWFQSQWAADNVEDVAKAYSASHPSRPLKETKAGMEFLESVTFLDFYPEGTQQSKASHQQLQQVIDMEEHDIHYASSIDFEGNSNRSNDENDNLFYEEGYSCSDEEPSNDCNTDEVNEYGSSSNENYSPKLKHRCFQTSNP